MTIARAIRLATEQRFDEAEVQYRLVRPWAAEYPSALHHLGVIALRRGDPERAEKLVRRSLKLAPDAPDALGALGLALGAQGRLREAARCFERATLADRATHRNVSKRSAGAVRDREAILAPTTGLHRLHAYLGRALMEAGEVAAATAVLARALASLVQGPAPAFCAVPVPTKRTPVALFPEAVRAASERLAVKGIDAFLVGGTLLGLVRDGGFLSFDKDVDFGVDAAVTPAALVDAFAGDPDFTPCYGTEAEAVLTGFRFKGGVVVDFFRFFRRGGLVWCGLTRGGHLMRWLHRPFTLAEARLAGVSVRIPADAETFLAECYGETWREPDPYFGVFASPNIEGGFPPISRCIAYRAMVRATLDGDRARLEALCRQVLALEPADGMARRVAEWLDIALPSSPARVHAGAGALRGPREATDGHKRTRKLPSRRRSATRSMIRRVETSWE